MLIHKSSMPVREDEVPELDEGWWSSILADEAANASSPFEDAQKADNQPSMASVDWPYVQSIYEHDEIVTLLVHGYNRGGLLVQGDRIQGFVPVSHLVDMPAAAEENDRRRILTGYIGRSLCLKVIECESAQERIVLSERAAQAGEGCRKQLFNTLKVGSIVAGTVTNVTDFGAFIDLGGVEGLIHVSELSWGRVQHPSEILVVGQECQVLVLQVSEESARIALSLKRLLPNPWETLAKKYKPGDVVSATVTTIMRFGAFARLTEGVEGLIHISSVHLSPGEKDLSAIVYSGAKVQVRILHIDAERRRLGLGLVQVE